jgi:hypothetical protein
MQFNAYIFFVAGLVPLVIGFIWYNPKVLGNAWLKSIDMTTEKMKGGNMFLIIGLSYLMGVLLAMGLLPLVVHQMGFMSSLEGEVGIHDQASDVAKYAQQYYDTYGTRFRTFKHGAFHGALVAFFLALPFFGMNALYEKKSLKYVGIHLGYWIITLCIMGGILCQWM